MSDRNGVKSRFLIDDLDRNEKTVMQLTGLEMPITFENTFDEANRRTQVTAKIGDRVDFVNQYAYDALGRVTGISQGEKRVDYAYNAAGQRTAASVFAGANKVFDTLYGYDGMGRLTGLTHANGDKVFADYDYSWDIANRITGFDFSYLGEKDEKTAEYGYDQTSQLVSADYNAFQPNEAYQYDTNGNRKNFETGKNNLLTSDGEFRYTYDGEGNRVEKMSISTGEKTQYTWDHRNRLTQVVTPKESVVYAYDYLNRMTRRNSEFVVHDGWQIVLILDTKGKVKDRNLWGVNQDELIATNDQFTLCDHLGSVRDVIDASGKVLNHIEYNAFGKVTRQTGKYSSVFGYTGKVFDEATGLQWNINRWYDAAVGKWILEDPAGFIGGITLPRYVHNMPMVAVDPFGLWKVVSGTDGKIYESDEDNDTLRSLSELILGHDRDWVCIWPIESETKWENYPDAKRCARADVSNLLAGEENTFKMMVSFDYVVTSDHYLEAARIVIDIKTSWNDGMDAATKIMNQAGKGASPISLLILAGHHWSGHGSLVTYSGGAPFNAADISAVATNVGIGNNSSNSYAHAVQKQGPPRCWMQYGGEIWGVGCTTKNTWASQMASVLARGGAHDRNPVSVYGTTELIHSYVYRPGDPYPTSLWPESETNPANLSTTWPAVRGWSIWHATTGTL